MAVQLILFAAQLYVASSMDKDTVDQLTPMLQLAEACGYESCLEPSPNKLNVHLVPHTHAELGYTATFHGHYTGHDDYYLKSQINMKRILDLTISELWVKPHRRFTLSDMAYFFHWWANRDETVRRMVYQLIRQGRLNFVGGGWSMSDEATTSYHAIIDHFTYSLRKINATFLSCGRPLVAWQADVLGHSREFASLLAQMGFDGLFVNPISYDDEIARMKRRGLEFVWRGSDDLGQESDIYTHKLFDGYWPPPGFCFGGQCTDPLLIVSSQTFTNLAERVEEFTKAVRFRQAPYYLTQNVMVVMGQRFGYYDASVWFDNIDRLIIAVNKKTNHTINLMYSTPACYLKAVYEANPDLQTKQDDFLPYAYDKDSYATGMYSSRPTLKHMAREGHRYLQIAKQLQVTAKLGNNDKLFEEYNWINGVFQDHNVITGELRPHVVSYYVEKMTRATKMVVDNIMQPAFNKLRNNPSNTDMIHCQFNVSRCRCTDGPNVFIVIYNPLSWPVTMPVRLPMYKREQIVYDPQGNKIPAGLTKIPEPVWRLRERNTTSSFELVFIAVDLPPMGFRSYYLRRNNFGWDRPKRALIKKINSKPKKYLVRQVAIKENPTEQPEYEYFDDATTRLAEPNAESNADIRFGNVGGNGEAGVGEGDVVTPKSRVSFVGEGPVDQVMTPKARVSFATTTDTVTPEEEDPTGDGAEETTEGLVGRHAASTEEERRRMATDIPFPSVATTEASNLVTRTPEPNDHVEEEYWTRYHCYDMTHNYIRNAYVRVNLDQSKQVVNISLASGIKMKLHIEMLYYVADDPSKMTGDRSNRRSPGAYLFRTMDEKPELIMDGFQTKVYKSRVVQEIHCRFSSWASVALRLYKDNPVLEVDWLVGPIPISDGLGKEVMIRYTTDLDNKGVFYTDSNGRQTMKRIRNYRPMFDTVNKDPIAGNLYPVTSKIHIEDLEKNVRFAVLNDRSQAGSSLKDGQVSLLLHRRLLTEDSGIQAILNETADEEGIVVRGLHYLYLSKATYKPHKVFEKKLAKEIELRPQIFTSPPWGFGINTKRLWLEQTNEFSVLKTRLPIGVHVLTLEMWNSQTLLLRLENYLETADCVRDGLKTVLLKDLFGIFRVKAVKETTLAGNWWLKDWVPLKWSKGKFLKSFNEAYGTGRYEFAEDSPRSLEEVDVDVPIVLRPQQIRTFVVYFEYV